MGNKKRVGVRAHFRRGKVVKAHTRVLNQDITKQTPQQMSSSLEKLVTEPQHPFSFSEEISGHKTFVEEKLSDALTRRFRNDIFLASGIVAGSVVAAFIVGAPAILLGVVSAALVNNFRLSKADEKTLSEIEEEVKKNEKTVKENIETATEERKKNVKGVATAGHEELWKRPQILRNLTPGHVSNKCSENVTQSYILNDDGTGELTTTFEWRSKEENGETLRTSVTEQIFPGADFSQQRGSEPIFAPRADLRGADFSSSKAFIVLEGADLRGANFERYKGVFPFAGMSISSDKSSGTLVNANLRGANLAWANFQNVNMRGADIRDADSAETVLPRDLRDLKMTKAQFDSLGRKRDGHWIRVLSRQEAVEVYAGGDEELFNVLMWAGEVDIRRKKLNTEVDPREYNPGTDFFTYWPYG